MIFFCSKTINLKHFIFYFLLFNVFPRKKIQNGKLVQGLLTIHLNNLGKIKIFFKKVEKKKEKKNVANSLA